MICRIYAVADVVDREQARRGGLRVPRERVRPAVHHPHKHFRRRCRKQGGAVQALVRPDRRLPHIHHLLEPQYDSVSSSDR